MKKWIKIALTSLIVLTVIGFLFVSWFYLKGINLILKSDFMVNKIQNVVHDNFDMDLELEGFDLKTHLKPILDFRVKNFTLKKDKDILLQLKNFDINAQYTISQKEFKLNRLKAETLLINADKLFGDMQSDETKEETKADWKVDFYNADLKLDDIEVTYRQKNNSLLELSLRDVYFDLSEEDKYLSFNLDAQIFKNDKLYAEIISSTTDEIQVFKDNLKMSNLRVLVNNSKLRLDSYIDIKTLDINAYSEIFYLEDIFKLLQSDFIVQNGSELLKPLTNPKGNVNFKVNYKNGDLSGYVNVNNTQAKLKDVSKIPINISKGKILITKDKVRFDNLEGFWGKHRKNEVKIDGDIKDYYKTFDSNIVIDTVVNNEFLLDYLAPLIKTKLVISSPSKTKLIYKAKNGVINLTWLAILKKGVVLGLDYEKSDLNNYERLIKGEFEIVKDDFDIKYINYYVAPELKRDQEPTPIFVIDAKMKTSGKVKNFGFSFGEEMPSETMNIFLKENIFKKGTMKGSAHIIYEGNKAYIDSDLEINKTFVPSQRLYIRQAKINTTPEFINLTSSGGFKRAKYDLTGKMVNKIDTPVILKDLDLHIDNLDVERFLESMNTDNDKVKEQEIVSEEIKDDNYMFDTNLLRVENADFTLDKGKYKDIDFANVKAKMTLDDKGILRLSSNRFDIAQGYSSLKTECDLVNLKYNVKLGVKDINSDLIASTLFNLNKEITGKASGIMDLSTDRTSKLNGTMKFIIKDGTIGKIGLVEYILKVASLFRNPIVMINPVILSDIVSVPEGKFEKITGSLDIKNNVVKNINIKSYSNSLSALIKGRFDMDRHDSSLRIYTRFSSNKKSVFNFLRNISLNTLANKVKLNSRNDTNYYSSELKELPSLEVEDNKTQVFLTQIEGDIEHNNFLSSLKKIK